VGHIKTVIILTGGCLFFGDEMPLKKFLGIATAMMGIVWYSQARRLFPVLAVLHLLPSAGPAMPCHECGRRFRDACGLPPR